jgi:hypothetical protein
MEAFEDDEDSEDSEDSEESEDSEDSEDNKDLNNNDEEQSHNEKLAYKLIAKNFERLNDEIDAGKFELAQLMAEN